MFLRLSSKSVLHFLSSWLRILLRLSMLLFDETSLTAGDLDTDAANDFPYNDNYSNYAFDYMLGR